MLNYCNERYINKFLCHTNLSKLLIIRFCTQEPDAQAEIEVAAVNLPSKIRDRNHPVSVLGLISGDMDLELQLTVAFERISVLLKRFLNIDRNLSVVCAAFD